MDLSSKREEKVLCVWAKVILLVGIIEGVCALIIGIVLAVNEESFLYFILSIVVATLLTIPFILMWASVRVLAKMSLNLLDTNSTIYNIYKLLTIVEANLKRNTESIQHTVVSSRPNNKTETASKQTVQNNKQGETNVPLVSVLIVLDEINKKEGSQADKLCRLMEMRDDGTISDEIYDAVLQKIS